MTENGSPSFIVWEDGNPALGPSAVAALRAEVERLTAALREARELLFRACALRYDGTADEFRAALADADAWLDANPEQAGKDKTNER